MLYNGYGYKRKLLELSTKLIRNILEYLEQDRVLFPDKKALVDETTSYTFSEFYDLSRRIGSAIAKKMIPGEISDNAAIADDSLKRSAIAKSASDNTKRSTKRSAIRKPIAVLMEKGADTLCAFMGIAYAGCFYVLLNPEFPESRLTQIQGVLEAPFIVTNSEHRELAEKLVPAERILLLSDLMQEEEDSSLLDSIRKRAIDTDPLYANFTSGSTGVPKGVVVGHRSVLDFIENFVPMFGIGNNDIIANQAPFDFDVSVKDIYSALKTGATLVIVPKRLFSQPVQLLDFLCDHDITTMIWAVSALCLITTCHGLDYKTPMTVKRVLFSGEVMPLKHLLDWMNHLPEAEFVNLYGPTEITCNCTYHRIDRNRDYSDGIPIGLPFPNEHVFLLDAENKEILEPDVTGEICVRGSALALGYFRNPEQTASAFPDDPSNSCYPEKIYRTGDLGRYADDGEELYFCGRKDFQIKYMGHRIEIEEIERAISDVDGIARCCVIFDESKQRLYGFYVGAMDKKELHAELAKTLPIYMIPGVLKNVEEFPLTKNGKIDRRALLERKARK